MLVQFVSLALSAALAQAAPVESKLLSSVPADADVVVRVRGADQTRADVAAMINAMSPTIGPQAAAALQQGITQFAQTFGDDATKSPFLVVAKVGAPAAPGQQPIVILVPEANYEGVLKSICKGKAPAIEKKDGLDTFQSPAGSTAYAKAIPGGVAFGPDAELVKSLVDPSTGGLAKALGENLTTSFNTGDVAAYVNIAGLTQRYEGQIHAAREQFMALLDQAGAQSGNAGMMESAKKVYGLGFDAIKYGQALVLSIDAAAEGLQIDGALTVKADTSAAKFLSTATPVSAAGLGQLPAGYSYYVAMNFDAETIRQLQGLNLSMLGADPSKNPEFAKAAALQSKLGNLVTVGATSMDEKGMRMVNRVKVSDPKAYIESTRAMMLAMKTPGEGKMDFVKDVRITPEAVTYKGYTFDQIELQFDVDKLAKSQPTPAGAQAITKMFGGDTSRTWVGTDGKDVVTVNAPSLEAAREIFDSAAAGDNKVGDSKGFQATMKLLPEPSNGAFLMSAQGLVRQITTQLGAVLGNDKLQPPADLPAEPVFLGFGANTIPGGIHFKAVLPSAAGPIFEKGLVPVIQGMQGRVNN